MTNDGSATFFGCTVGGTGAAPTAARGSAKASRSPATDEVSRVNTTPATPLSAPAARNPSVTSDSRRPGSGVSAAASAGASVNRPESSRRNTTTPHAVPTSVGTTSTAVAPARDSTAAQPAIPATTIAMLPTGTRRVSNVAAIAAIAAITASTSTDRTSLSAMPKIWIAHSLTGPGVRSMTADPTAVRASACGPNGTATNCVTPSATAAAAMPHRARVPRADPAM